MTDAKFSDGAEQPLRLKAESPDDLAVISTFVQDAVGQNAEISWLAKKHRFAVLLNRFRWEDRTSAEQQGRRYERVQSMLVVDSALKVTSLGLDSADKDMAFELLSISFEPSEDGAGQVILTLAGDGAIALDVECLDVSLSDVSRPYVARSSNVPSHPVE
ncbi:MAG: DUF2948 family protein [Paracoccaceae bacterium]|jgi:hypothetical protein